MFLSQTCPVLYSVLENQDEESSSSTKSVVAEKQTTVKKRKQQPGGETQPARKKKAGLKNCGPLSTIMTIWLFRTRREPRIPTIQRESTT